jgi:hydroxymethylglutaryl-CoA lyase
MHGITRKPGVVYSALVPNMKGFEAAVEAKVEEVAVFAAASESFSQRNTNCSIAESLARFEPVMAAARDHGMRVRGYVSCVLGCPYEGEIAPAAVARVSKALHEMGCHEVSLGDTIGVGTPVKARAKLHAVSHEVPMKALAVHFHDTYDQALANILACLEEGVRVVDSSVSGTGGCPYAKGATGNVASEDVAYMLQGMGIETGVDLDKLVETGWWLAKQLGKPTSSRVTRARMGE